MMRVIFYFFISLLALNAVIKTCQMSVGEGSPDRHVERAHKMSMLGGLVRAKNRFIKTHRLAFRVEAPTVTQYLIRHNLPDGLRANQI